MELSQDIVIYLLGLAATSGTILARISALEKKVEKHNSLIERVYKLEKDAEFANDRIEKLENGGINI